MDVSEFSFRIILLGLPGILCFFLLKKLIRFTKGDTLEIALFIFLLGAMSYALYSGYWAYFRWCQAKPLSPYPIQQLFNASPTARVSDIIGASITAVYLSLTLGYFHRIKLWNQLGQKLHVTDRYGDEDVWEYFFNSDTKDRMGGWIYVRDHKANLLYYGYGYAWSEREEIRELLLAEVDVYSNDDAKHLYSCKHMYLAREPNELSIEVAIADPEPKPQNDTTNTEQTTTAGNSAVEQNRC
jgi:hypothetical protein